MSIIVKLVQGSAEWHEHRRRYRNASETPVVMGVSPWQTPYQLWQHKLGLSEPEVTPAMLRGMELEPAARAAYEARTGLVMQPLVVLDGEYSASLDGLTLAGERLVEIKCPVKGRDSTLWKTIEARRLPEPYVWQVQHQLMVTKAEVADVFVFDGREGLLFPVAPNPSTWPQMHAAWDTFMRSVTTKCPPPLVRGDVRERDDPEWIAAAAAFLVARHSADEAQRNLDEAKTRLITLTTHSSESGGGVSVTRYWKTGTIDYKKIPELKAIDLDQYRGAMREETRITISA
jgi:putative phage-type endonuclease